MNGNDIPAFRPKAQDLITAVALLTRVPLPGSVFRPNDPRPPAFAAWAYPLIGVLIAGLSVVTGAAALALGLPANIAALLTLFATVIATGAMHEDGLADCADGFWGGWTPDRRLEIMKDSQIGTYGVLALIISFGVKWGALAALMATQNWVWCVLAGCVASRAAMVGVMFALPHARQTGLSRHTGRPPVATVLVAFAVMCVTLAVALPSIFLYALIFTCIALISVTCIAKFKIGGQTGDVLGASQQCVEITLLLCCVSALT